jgi:hypothetical protein
MVSWVIGQVVEGRQFKGAGDRVAAVGAQTAIFGQFVALVGFAPCRRRQALAAGAGQSRKKSRVSEFLGSNV